MKRALRMKPEPALASNPSASGLAPTERAPGATRARAERDALSLNSGEQIGPFVLTRQLGRGGFAPVWMAREQYGGVELRPVALKVFALDQADPGSAQGSQRSVLEEARALCLVEHPNVVRFYAIALDPVRNLVGLAMEYLSGRPLDREIDDRDALPVSEVIDIGLSVASALAAVHRTGVVHRDVKPANIVRTSSGYKLIDFGIAHGLGQGVAAGSLEAEDVQLSDSASDVRRLSLRGADNTTRPREVGELCGTLGYIDPECLRTFAAPSAPASDLYALGATLFELLTARLPAESGSVLRGDVLDGRQRPEPLASVRPDAPSELCLLVDSLLSPSSGERPRSAEWVLSRLQEIRYRLAGGKRELPAENVGPFRGLGRFEAGDRGIYFGRTLEVAQALQVLRLHGLVALLGPSGSGKSSLARAGLLPAILEGQLGSWPEAWDAVVCVPGEDPRASLLAELTPILGRCQELSAQGLAAELAEHTQASGRGLVLLVDQLEELATVSRGQSRDFMVGLLAWLAEHPVPGLRVVVTARRDLLDPLLGLSGLGRALLPNAVLVDAMTALTWTDVLEQALAAYGYGWETEALRQQVAREIERTASAMPLVQFALSRLWESRDRQRRVLTERGFSELGGIAGALAIHAEFTLAALGESVPDAEEVARNTLLTLTTAQGTRAVRGQQELEAAAGVLARSVLEAFERDRLVVRLPEGYTLSHEVLLSEWPRLRGWLAEVRDARLLLAELEHDAARWQATPSGVPMWRARRLSVVEDALLRARIVPDEASRAFLAAGRRAERRRRVTLGLTLFALLALGITLTTAYVHSIQNERVQTARALEAERTIRKVAESQTARAEAQTRAVKEAQKRIDELVRGLADSPQKAEVLALQEQIRGASSASAPGRSGPRVRRGETEPPAPSSVAGPSSASVQPAEPPKIRVQNDW